MLTDLSEALADHFSTAEAAEGVGEFADAGDSLAFPSDLEPVDRDGHRRRSGLAADIGAFELAPGLAGPRLP